MSTKDQMEKKKSKRKHRVYTPEFKLEAAKLAKEIGSSEASKKLSVPLSCIDKWKSGHSMKAVQPAAVKELQAEIKRLQRQLNEEQAINAILKKTAAIFSKDHLK